MGNVFSGHSGADALKDLRELIDKHDHEVPLNAKQIQEMLELVAKELAAHKKDITIVAIGGAVNCVLLHSRLTTGDVDFFYSTKQKSEDVSAVIDAAKVVAKKSALGDAWLNNHTAVFMQEDQIGLLYAEAHEQDRPIFKHPGLTVLAAPWRYALATKLDRLMKTGHKDYDLSDAATYLHEHITQHGKKPVSHADLEKWAGSFKFTVPSKDLIKRLGYEYKNKFGGVGVE